MQREWLLLSLKKFWKIEILIFITVTFHTLFTLLDPYILKFLIDKAIIPRNIKILLILLTILTSVLIIRELLNVTAGYLYRYAGSRISFYLRNLLLTKFLSSNYFFFEKHKKGDIITRVTEDVSNLESFLTETLIDVVMNCLSVVIIYCFLFILNWKLALITVLILPFAPLSMRMFRSKIEKVAKEEREKASEHLSFWENILAGLKEIKIFGIQRILGNKFMEIARRCIEKRVKLQLWRLTSGFTGEVISTFILFPLIFGYGSYLVFQGEFTIGGLISFHTYVFRVMFPLLFLFRLQVILSTLKASIQRIDEIYSLPYKEREIIGIPRIDNIRLENQKYIYFKNVVFRYKEDAENVLKNVSFQIPLKKWVCIIGEVGSGKTTIAYLLLKFLKPITGKILIDKISLEDIKDEIWYKNVSYVGQFPFLFNFSVEENILMGRKKDKRFEEVVEIFKIKEFLQKIGKDLRDKMGELSEKLSGGEKQMICLARAFLKDSPILILDEATSNMDVNTEKNIIEVLKQRTQNKTVIFITHRTYPLVVSDYVIFVSKGRIEGEGEFYKLKDTNKKFMDYIKKYEFKRG